jgi:hypothetical protein
MKGTSRLVTHIKSHFTSKQYQWVTQYLPINRHTKPPNQAAIHSPFYVLMHVLLYICLIYSSVHPHITSLLSIRTICPSVILKVYECLSDISMHILRNCCLLKQALGKFESLMENRLLILTSNAACRQIR